MTRSPVDIWVLAARPKTLAAAAAPVLIGIAMAHAAGGFHLWSALAALTGALLIQIGTNFANDYYDHKKGTDTEDRLGPLRVTQAGLVAPATMKRATYAVFGLAILVGVHLVWRGGWPIVVIGLLSVLFGVLYTGGPCPLGYNGLADIFVLIFFGPVAVGGTYYVQTLTIHTPVLLAGLAPGLFSVAILTVNNLRDIDNDRAGGKKTLTVRFGKTFARFEYLTTIVVACLLPVVLHVLYDTSPYPVISAATLLLAIPCVRQVFTVAGKPLNDTLAATGRLLLIFSVLFSIGWIL